MRPRWMVYLFIVSLAFNLAIITGYLLKSDSEEQRAIPDRIAASTQIELSRQQKQDIKRIMKAFDLQMIQFKQEILKQRMDIIDELSDPECDFNMVQQLTKSLNHTENRLNQLFVKALVEINAILDSPQRLDFLLALSRNWFFLNGAQR